MPEAGSRAEAEHHEQAQVDAFSFGESAVEGEPVFADSRGGGAKRGGGGSDANGNVASAKELLDEVRMSRGRSPTTFTVVIHPPY